MPLVDCEDNYIHHLAGAQLATDHEYSGKISDFAQGFPCVSTDDERSQRIRVLSSLCVTLGATIRARHPRLVSAKCLCQAIPAYTTASGPAAFWFIQGVSSRTDLKNAQVGRIDPNGNVVDVHAHHDAAARDSCALTGVPTASVDHVSAEPLVRTGGDAE